MTRSRDPDDRRRVTVKITPEATRGAWEVYGPLGEMGIENQATILPGVPMRDPIQDCCEIPAGFPFLNAVVRTPERGAYASRAFGRTFGN